MANMTNGALAAKLQPVPGIHVEVPGIHVEVPRSHVEVPGIQVPLAHAAPNFKRPMQGLLFPERPASNVIPIAAYAPVRVEARPRARAEAGSHPSKPAVKRPKAPEGQGSLDFLPSMPAQPRKLGTTVEAVIYCELPVATTLHRAVAASLDWSMVLIGYGLFLLAFRLMGGEFILTKANLSLFGAMFLLIGFTYGLFFALAGTETPGMCWTQLRLTTFDGFPPEKKHRFIRFGGACLSRCTLLGLLWSLADEECLTWQDHISLTFPTPRELDSQLIRRC
jgi:uncharacterized RDD family membrane protein YckC